jgi:hypothetical protein
MSEIFTQFEVSSWKVSNQVCDDEAGEGKFKFSNFNCLDTFLRVYFPNERDLCQSSNYFCLIILSCSSDSISSLKVLNVWF